MKRTLLIFAVAMVSFVCFAQKSNVSKANSLATAEENPNYDEAKALIEAALVNPETKDLVKTVWTGGHVYELSAKAAAYRDNFAEAGADALRSYELYMQAWDMDHQPNAKGKVKPAYDKKISESLASIYRSNILVNYAVAKQNEEAYADAYRATNTHLGIIDLDIIKSDEKLLNDTNLRKNDAYYQIKYFAGNFAWLAGDRQNAIKEFKGTLGSGYKEEQVYQYICQIYEELHDSVNYVDMLRQGASAIPSSQWLVGNLINYYIEHGNSKQAVEYLDQAISSNPTAQLYNVKGSVLELSGDLENSLLCYNRAIDMDANYSDAYSNIGRFYYNQGVKIEEDNMNENDKKKNAENIAKMNEMFLKSIPYFEKAYELDTENTDTQRMLKINYFRAIRANSKYKPKHPQLLPEQY
ncbi:MAG: tetratricopeptide repeat protein [Paludibacteraceae bacterium]|nr:tetratricopeptide repeat protein [Paludibacteraceae bacterium]